MPVDLFDGVFRPAVPGCAVATPGRPRGTLGCVVRDRALDGVFYILSAAHVIANHTFDPLGLPVLQPGAVVQGDQVIGRLVRWGQLTFTTDTFPNLFDAAIAQVDASSVVPDIVEVGRPSGVRNDVPEGTRLKKCGARSQVTEGVVVDANYPCAFTYHDPQGNPFRAGFQQQLLCRPAPGSGKAFSEPGDSGAAVVDEQKRVVGLVVGATKDGTVVSPIGPMLQALQIAIP